MELALATPAAKIAALAACYVAYRLVCWAWQLADQWLSERE
jgi:hypothetical protein